MSWSRLVVAVIGALAVLGLFDAAAVSAQSLKPATRITRELAELPAAHATAVAAGVPLETTRSRLPVSGGFVTIDAAAAGDPAALAADLAALGAQRIGVAGRLVSARVPITAIPSLNGLVTLRFARPAYFVTNAGSATSQGDRAMRADAARATFGLDGTGVTVGVLSDSFDCLGGFANDAVSGDLPTTVTVIEDVCSSGNDEGRAMLQIVHDVAPGADLAFATADGGEANFANNVRALRDAGATVIVDDVIYLAEPMFQDGLVAQAVDEVTGSGVAYFSAAGNNARQAYASAFVPGPALSTGQFGPDFFGGTAHLFGPGNFKQRVTVPSGGGFVLVLQWDAPFGSLGGDTATTNDVDVYVLDSTSTQVVFSGISDNIAAGDPVELVFAGCDAPTSCVFNLMIVNAGGPNPGRFKYVLFGTSPGMTLSPALNAGTIYGHANALGAVAVGAADYRKTPAFGVSPPVRESFSAGGTTPVLLDTAGHPLATPDLRQFKPEIVAPDGGNTTFFGFDTGDADAMPNFFGTSAAAPHAAGVAALLRQVQPSLTPEHVRHVLENTAINMGAAGFDTDTGFGLIQADAALSALHVFAITSPPSGTPNPVNGGGTVSVTASATDSFGHVPTYAWTSTCTGLPSNGTFDDANLASPTWTAPANTTGLSKPCVLTVTVDDGHGFTRTGSYTQTVAAPPRITSFTPAAGPVGTTVTIMGTSFAGATDVSFGGNVTAPATLVTSTSVTAVVPEGAVTGRLGVTTPAGAATSAAIFKVMPKITGFSPASVVAGAGTTVTITGLNLRAATGSLTVRIGALTIPAILVLTSSSTAIDVRLPAAAITGKLGVTTVDGTGLSASNLEVIRPPRPTSFTPAGAPAGATVTINGSNLAGTSLVIFGGAVTVAPTAVTATSMKATVPDGAATGKLAVTNDAGTGMTAGVFKVQPAITGFAPTSVAAGSPTVVTITGTTLQALSGATTVKVGAFTIPPASVLLISPSEIQFSVPAAATTGKIGVTTIDGTGLSAASLVVIKPPKPTTVTPAAAPIGALVTINGTNLAGTSALTFGGGAMASPGTVAANAVTATVPDGALTGPVSVTNDAGTGTTASVFKVQPRILDVSPSSVVAGSTTVVTIAGSSLVAASGTPTVKLGPLVLPAASVLSASATEITFRLPPRAQSGKVSVTTIDGTTLSAGTLQVIRPPQPTTIAPVAGAVDSEVTITGTNLTGVTEVLFASNVSAAPTLATATVVKVRVPPGAVSGYVSVFNAAGGAPVLPSFTLLPRITGFAPDSGAAGEQITISGYNFGVGDEDPIVAPVVRVGTFAASVLSASQTELTVVVPRLAKTSKIRVTSAAGAAVSATDFVVTTPPRPDLETLSIQAPFAVLRSTPRKAQTISVTTTVSNQGPAAAGPFGIALIMEPVDVPGAPGPLPPLVVGMRKVPGLASGATSTGTTTVTVPLDVLPGLWAVRAEPDWNGDLAELTERDGKGPFAFLPLVQIIDALDGPYRVSLTIESSPCTPFPSGVTLTGSTALRQFVEFGPSMQFEFEATLSGSGLVVRLTDGFGSFDSNGVVDGFLTFESQVDGALFQAIGGYSGVITDGVFGLSFTVFAGNTPECNVTGVLSLTPPSRRGLSFEFFAAAGTLGPDSLAPLPAFPVATHSWTPVFTTQFDAPEDLALTFFGPGGFVSPVPSLDSIDFLGTRIVYRGAPVTRAGGSAEPPAGAWQVVDKGVEYPFTVAPPQSAARLVIPVPAFSTADDGARRLTWTYRTPAGAPLAAAPAFIRSIAVTLTGGAGGELYTSGRQSNDTRRVTVPDDVPLDCFSSLAFDYEDTAGNTYRVTYGRPVSDLCASPGGTPFVTAALMTREGRGGTSTVRSLSVTFEPAAGLVQAAAIDGDPFMATPLPFGGTRRIGGTTVDRFDLDYDVPVGTPYPPRNTDFAIEAILRSGEPQIFGATLQNSPTDDPVTFTGFVASTFDIGMVRGVARTYTWGLDAITFEISSTLLTGVARNARGERCLTDDVSLSATDTEATLTVPPICVGRPTTAADVCLTVFGTGGEISSYCRVYDTPPPASAARAAGR